MSLEIGGGEALAGALNGEAELMQQSRNVLRVVVHAEALLDPLADKRSGPHTRLEPGRERPSLDDTRHLGSLLVRQAGRPSWKRAGT